MSIYKRILSEKGKFLIYFLLSFSIISQILSKKNIKEELKKINFDNFLELSKFNTKPELYENTFKEQTKNLKLETILKDNGSNLEKFSISFAKYFLKIAAFSYCSEENILKQNCCSDLFTNDEWKLYSEESVEYDDYHYAILIHKKYKKIVVTFPGTNSATQLIKELYYSNGVIFKDDETEKIMEYLKTVYSKFNQNLEIKLLKLFKEFNEYQFIFTGHSLGGNMAAISILYSTKYGSLKNSNDPVLITYGQARTGNDIFANEIMKYIKKVYRITRRGDIVTSIPPCSWTLYNWSIKCDTILPDRKFDPNFIMNEEQRNTAKENFYSWHIAGWYSFNDQMDYYKYCGQYFSEDNDDPDCQLYTNYFDISKHIEYFGIQVGEFC